VAYLFILSIYVGGCSNKFWDPKQIGRFRPVPAVNVILDTLGVAEEAPSAWVGAEEPRPADAMVLQSDYVFSPGDIIRISIFELLREADLFVNDYIVTETGKISVPEVGVIAAAGLTESQLEEEIKDIVEPSLLKKPSVTATLVRSEKRAFSILGQGVPRPNRYFIPRYGFRLADALATAGGIGEFNVSNIYVSRLVSGQEVRLSPAVKSRVAPSETGERGKPGKELVVPEEEMLEIIAPRAKEQRSENKLVVASAELVRHSELAEAALPAGFESGPGRGKSVWGGSDSAAYEERGFGQTARSSGRSPGRMQSISASAIGPAGREAAGKATGSSNEGRVEWIFEDGKWVPVQVGRPRPVRPEVEVAPEKPEKLLEERAPADFTWDEVGMGGMQTRVIRIPVDKFQAGDPRYNIAIRPGDTIYVPVDIIGEFYVTGNTANRGTVNLTGRPMTLKMAIAAAGGLGELAWPKRCEVVRRLGKNREEIVMVDLDKIARGEQPDFFIKPDDLINVGTHPTSMWRYVLRNAFRATYGFDFNYSRNFADRDVYTHRPFPGWLPSMNDIF